MSSSNRDSRRTTATVIYRVLLLLALFASCESTDAPLVLYESPHGLVVLKAVRVDFAEEGKEAAAAWAHFAAGEDHLSAGRCGAAAESYLQAAARRPSPAVWLNAGVALLCDGEYERAGEVLAKGLESAKAAGRKDVRAALLGNLGQAHQRLGRLDSALVSYQDALALHRQSGFAAGEAQALGDLGAAYFMQGDPEQALSFLKQARDGHRRIGDQLGLARDLDRLGTVYFVRGAADSALATFTEALALYQGEEYLRGQAGGLTNIGNIHLDEGRLDSAHFYFSAGLAVLEHLADDAARATQLARIGQIYQQQDAPEA
ncbi:MAG: tetratricopeptide repeat protein, partial [Gemmatimonadetes bacterium]|nr:tetratricopeptide repeat protein [Gemmatimonadota bacterium]